MTFTRCTILIAVFALTFPVLASGPEIGWNGWGVRIGLADDFDQVLAGAHFNLGEFV
ncbi:MAG: hypothetical protein IH924_05075, partial [Proteobacteria bacterium]|nr:hypothetical protein [Pseudomonadota bacterium]